MVTNMGRKAFDNLKSLGNLFLFRNSGCCALFLVVLAITGKFVLADTTAQNSESLNNSDETTLFSSSPYAFDRYKTCDDFLVDAIEIIIIAGNATIQAQKTQYCDMSVNFDNYESSYYDKPVYNTKNQVPEVDEMNLIKSDGMYFFIGQRERIIVSDFNGTVIANVTLPSLSNAKFVISTTFLTSLFINNNLLTALAEVVSCDDWNSNCKYATRAFVYQFKDTSDSPLTMLKQFDVFSSNSFGGTDTRNIGNYTYVFSTHELRILQHRCSDEFKTLSADEYERVALEILNKKAEAYAKEMATLLGQEVDGGEKSCANILKVSSEALTVASRNQSAFHFLEQSFAIQFLQLTSFTYDRASQNIKSSTSFVPFVYSSNDFVFKKPVLYLTNKSLLIAFPSARNTHLLKYDLYETLFTPSAIGEVEGFIMSSSSIDFYNGYFRIIAYSSPTSPYSMEVRKPKLFVFKQSSSKLQKINQLEGLDQANKLSSIHVDANVGFWKTTQQIGSIGNLNDRPITVASLRLIHLWRPENPTFIGKQLDLPSDENFLFYKSIENGKLIITVTEKSKSTINETAILIRLFQVNDEGFTQVGNHIETIFHLDASHDTCNVRSNIWAAPNTFKYLRSSQRVIFEAWAFYYDPKGYNPIERESFNGFLVYHVNQSSGLAYVGNITTKSLSFRECFPSQVFEVNGDIVTFLGAAAKTTQSVTLNTTTWNITQTCIKDGKNGFCSCDIYSWQSERRQKLRNENSKFTVYNIHVKAEEDLYLEGSQRTIKRVSSGDLYTFTFPFSKKQFCSLFRNYAEVHGLREKELEFSFVDLLKHNDTPASVSMIQGDTVIVRKKRRLQDEEEVHVLNTNGAQESTPNLHYKRELDQECRPFSTRDGKAKSNEKIKFYIKAEENLFIEGSETSIQRVAAGSTSARSMLKNSKFSYMFRDYAEKQGLRQDELEFVFVGILEPNDTPENVQLQRGDTIMVRKKTRIISTL